ncbi:TPA: DNA-directed RNA polymerase, partial [Staphylococcus aureus]|nr:DNA-directed RNA polymerase [Staphylococcus aureus]
MSKIAAQKKFMYFLQGFNPEEIPSEEKLKKLKKYVNNEEKAMFISDT